MATLFPKSGDEDVEIHPTSDSEDKLMLHSYVLALHSQWFQASLSERWNAGDQTDGRKTRIIYELRFDPDSAFGLLARQAEASDTATATEMISRTTPEDAPIKSKKLHKRRLSRVNAHKRMLEAMYHIATDFPTNFNEAKTSLLELAEIAEAYGCEKVVRIHITNHLNFSRDQVLAECATNAMPMLELATSVKVDWIFIEASAHVIGRGATAFLSGEATLRAMGVWELFQRKRAAFRDALVRCEMEMFVMQLASYGGGACQQVAIDYFRQWLAEQLRARLGSKLGKEYASMYREITRRGSPGSSRPSDLQEVKDFLNRCRTKFSLEDLSTGLTAVFANAANIIAPILKDAIRRQDKTEDPFRALLFMTVSDNEIPWLQKKAT